MIQECRFKCGILQSYRQTTLKLVPLMGGEITEYEVSGTFLHEVEEHNILPDPEFVETLLDGEVLQGFSLGAFGGPDESNPTKIGFEEKPKVANSFPRKGEFIIKLRQVLRDAGGL